MDYKGKLYGKVAGQYIPLAETAEDIDNQRELLREAMNVLRRGQRDEQYELAKRIEDHLGDYAREGWIDLQDKKEGEE